MDQDIYGYKKSSFLPTVYNNREVLNTLFSNCVKNCDIIIRKEYYDLKINISFNEFYNTKYNKCLSQCIKDKCS